MDGSEKTLKLVDLAKHDVTIVLKKGAFKDHSYIRPWDSDVKALGLPEPPRLLREEAGGWVLRWGRNRLTLTYLAGHVYYNSL